LRTILDAVSMESFHTPSTTAFVSLQVLDVLSTLIGTKAGAREANMFISLLMQFGPVFGLLICKLIAVALMIAAVVLNRARIITFANFWFTGIVGWNLGVIFFMVWKA